MAITTTKVKVFTKTKVKVILPWLVMVSGPSDLISTFHCVTRERVLFSRSQSRYKKSEQGRPKDEAFFVQFCEKHRTIPPFVWAPATNKQKDFKASLFLSSLPFLTIILCWQELARCLFVLHANKPMKEDQRSTRDNLGRPFKRPAHGVHQINHVPLFPRPPLCLFVPKLRKEKSSSFAASGSLPRGGRCRSAQRCSCPALGRRATCDITMMTKTKRAS